MSTPPEPPAPPAGPIPEQVAAAAEKERIAAENLRTAQEHEATKTELEALRKEKEGWATERAALEARATRVVPAPVPKADKPPVTPPPAPEGKRKRRLQWFPDQED